MSKVFVRPPAVVSPSYIVSLYKSIYKLHINIANISADKQQDNFYHMVISNADHKLKNLTFIYIYKNILLASPTITTPLIIMI